MARPSKPRLSCRPGVQAAVPVGHVVHRGADLRDQVRRRLEDAAERARAAELVDRRAVLVGHQEAARARIDDEPFGIEAPAETSHVGIQAERVQAIERLGVGDGIRRRGQESLGIGELDRLLHPKLRDLARLRIHLQREALHPRCVVQHAAAGSAVRQRPPFLADRVVVEIREEAESTGVRPRLPRGVERVAGDHEAIDERGVRPCAPRGDAGDRRQDKALPEPSHRIAPLGIVCAPEQPPSGVRRAGRQRRRSG